MKKLFLSLSILFAFVKGYGQCSPDTKIGGDLMYPIIMADAMAGQDYSQIITFRIPADSNILYNNTTVHATVDSARVVYIGGIPKGYSYACTPSRCTWPGGSLGCALLSGRCEISDNMVGEYPIKIYVQTWFKVASIGVNRIDSSSNYTFKIKAYNGKFEVSPLQTLKVYPNPSESIVNIELRGVENKQGMLEIYSSDGRLVMQKNVDTSVGYLTTEKVDLTNEKKGIYLIRMVSGDQINTQRILLK